MIAGRSRPSEVFGDRPTLLLSVVVDLEICGFAISLRSSREILRTLDPAFDLRE